jgi:hypothetical protein
MGSADMNNRIKGNLSLKNKSNKYRKAYFNQTVNLNDEFEFKTPTEEDLLKTQKSNRAFLKKEKRKNRNLLGFSFLVVIIFYLWLF